jgi:hypothetical protein
LKKFYKKWEVFLETNGCNARDLTNAKIILNEIDIPKAEQDEFLQDCRDSGGFCDCEIFLNSEEYRRKKHNK